MGTIGRSSLRGFRAPRLSLALLAASLILVAAGAGVARANNWGQREVWTRHSCPSDVCKIRAVRARFQAVGPWTTAPGNAIYTSLDVEPSASTLIQIGYDLEGAATPGVDDCGDGGHRLRISVEWETAGAYHCRWGPPVAPGEAHTLAVARCAGWGDWCAYIDGRPFGRPHHLGQGYARDVYFGAEQYENTTSSHFDVKIGGLRVARNGWSARRWSPVSERATCLLNDAGDFTVTPIVDGAFHITSAPARSLPTYGC
ncbi:MAG: hypothetical protein ACTHNU_15405 [Gaiellales bacterium]